MQTFAQQQKQLRKPGATSLARANIATAESAHREHPLIHLQRTIGNQAVQRMVQAHAEERKAGMTSTAVPYFGHDFIRIPHRPAPAGVIQTKLAINKPGDAYEQEADRIATQVMRMPALQLQGACSCGGRCPTCQTGQSGHTQERLQPRHLQPDNLGQTAVPPIVHKGLGSPGQPLDPASRAFMESRFGYDFSRVRVHSDAQAAESAQAVNASAYTVGHHIVFDRGQYRPGTTVGQQLLAHELTHVVQQAHGMVAGVLQREERRPRLAAVDENAQRIINLAQDTSQPLGERAVAVVQAIINQYYAGDTSRISRITYRESEPGLGITYTGSGANTTGQLTVGRYFVENTTQAHFARRVAQVRHELEHVEQQRAGMRGESRQDEREFIAFYHEALFQEPAGTGRIQHSSRVQLIDAALGYYYCLSADLQEANTRRRDELITRRGEAVRRSGHSDLGAAPTSCQRQRH
jgi:hypothetical protein